MNGQLSQQDARAHSNFAGRRLLVLEDRLVNQAVIEEQLRKLGVEFTLVPNGVLALQALEHTQFDIVLCDCAMPEMDGFEFTRTLRRQELPGRRIPVIALTANDSQEDANEATMAGMDDFLSKPVTPEKLASVLGKWLNPLAAQEHPGSASPAGAGAAPLVINMRILAEILGTSSVETVRQILEDSLATVGASLAEVVAASNSGDPARLSSAVRNAKGEARCVAAIGLANVYAKMEQDAKNGNRAATRDDIAKATVEVGLVERFIRSYLTAPSCA